MRLGVNSGPISLSYRCTGVVRRSFRCLPLPACIALSRSTPCASSLSQGSHAAACAFPRAGRERLQTEFSAWLTMRAGLPRWYRATRNGCGCRSIPRPPARARSTSIRPGRHDIRSRGSPRRARHLWPWRPRTAGRQHSRLPVRFHLACGPTAATTRCRIRAPRLSLDHPRAQNNLKLEVVPQLGREHRQTSLGAGPRDTRRDRSVLRKWRAPIRRCSSLFRPRGSLAKPMPGQPSLQSECPERP